MPPKKDLKKNIQVSHIKELGSPRRFRPVQKLRGIQFQILSPLKQSGKSTPLLRMAFILRTNRKLRIRVPYF
jgi:hypothetical protein